MSGLDTTRVTEVGESPPRVRDQAREVVALMSFSAAASACLALLLVIFTALVR